MKKLLQLGIIVFGINVYSQNAGSLDTSFGNGGKVITSFFTGADIAKSVAIQNDGKIIVAGDCMNTQNKTDFGIIRYNINGSIDTTFGINGKALFDVSNGIPLNYNDYVSKVLLTASGKILITGQKNNALFAIIRLNSDGTLDTTYGVNGSTTFSLGGSSIANSAIMQTDGKVVIVGENSGSSSSDFAIARINADGTLDLDFSNDGKTTVNFGTYDNAKCVTIDNDGKILVGGSNGSTTACMVRLNSDGNIDNTFGTLGKVIFDLPSINGEVFGGINVQPDNKITISGEAGNDFLLVRYNQNGQIETTFGTNGFYKIDIDNNSEDNFNSMFIQQDGKIILSGETSTGGNYYFTLVRCNVDGTFDTSFSSDGKQLTSFGTNWSMANDVICQSDGKIIAVGNYGNYWEYDFAIARYLGTNNLNLNEFDKQNSLTIYPNPVKNNLQINLIDKNLANSKYQILDLNGRVITNENLSTETKVINVENLVNGLYLFKIKNISIKFIKE